MKLIYGRYLSISLAILLLSLLCISLYVPFLKNGIVFDDHGLFSSLVVYDYSYNPFDFRPRTFPYFTLGLIQVLYGNIEENRIFSLILHIACASVLFLLLKSLLKQALKLSEFVSSSDTRDVKIQILAILFVAWFAIHPIAVYGAGYLAQRTILFATLFSLISLWFYLRGFAENRTSDIVAAAFFYSLAVFSKEHAIMLPAVAVALTPLYDENRRSHCKRILLFLALCAPAAITVFLAAKHVVATGYEPDVGAMIPLMQDISLMDKLWGQWLVSMVVQAGFFFDYLAFWMVPDVRVLSADMRFDFVHIWFSWWSFPKAFLFFLSPVIAIYFLRKKGLVALFCCGFLYCWFLFLTELTAVRFQEPFVLYRSYLWAPGYVIMIAALCARVPLRWLIIAALPLFSVFFLLSRDRLTSLESEASVWKDAASKLVSPSLIGSDRIFYNRGRAYLQEKRYAEAIDDFSQVIQMSPKISQAYYNRALALYALKKDSEALRDLDLAASINQKDSSIQYARGMIFERNGCVLAANRAYSESLKFGNMMAKMKLETRAKNASKDEKHLSHVVKCPA